MLGLNYSRKSLQHADIHTVWIHKKDFGDMRIYLYFIQTLYQPSVIISYFPSIVYLLCGFISILKSNATVFYLTDNSTQIVFIGIAM